MNTSVVRGRTQFLLLALLFAAPLIAACVLYFFLPAAQPEGRTNYGELIAPARPAPAFRWLDASGHPVEDSVLRGRWSYLYLGTTACGDDCAQKLYQIRQIRLLLNEKRLRVQRVYVAPDLAALQAARERLSADHPDLIFLTPAPESPAPLDFFSPQEPQALYLLDPLANWMMRYPAAAESPGILKDIKRLLRLSQIG
ncbi:MAG: SCO family protein [Gammaproteobacteria bacterium]|jgi:cytochrome oxidase Cu insertion factor (SCO1/SenC/PrrC family)